jgi:hypothetical protein
MIECICNNCRNLRGVVSENGEVEQNFSKKLEKSMIFRAFTVHGYAK